MNSDLSDIATGLSTAVTKDGQTTITNPIKFANGAVGAPSITFASDTDTGIYRIGANNIGFTFAGTKGGDWSVNGLAITGTLSSSDALTTTSGGHTITAGGLTVTAGGITLTAGAMAAFDGTKTAPPYSWTNDTDTGIYRIGANNIGISCGDTKIVDIVIGGITVTGGIVASNGLTVSAGTVSLPAGSIANAALANPGGLVLIKVQSASASATLDFVNGVSGVVFDGTYTDYLFLLSGIIPATNDRPLIIQVGTGGTPTYQTTGYYNDGPGAANAGAVANPIGGNNVSGVFMANVTGSGISVGNTANGGLRGRVEISNPAASVYPHFSFHASWLASATSHGTAIGGGFYGTAGAITAVRFKFDSGNITSGTIAMYAYTKV